MGSSPIIRSNNTIVSCSDTSLVCGTKGMGSNPVLPTKQNIQILGDGVMAARKKFSERIILCVVYRVVAQMVRAPV